MTAVLSDTDAAELADLLGLLEDWLLHADDDVLEVLGRFVWPGTCAPQQYVGGLIDRLGEHSVRLSQQLHHDEPDDGKDGEPGDE
jgi:hypothetical protein